MYRLVLAGSVGLLAVVPVRGAAAQRMSGVEVGVLAPGDGGLLQVGYRFAVLNRNSLGIDVAVATLPQAVLQGVALLGADLDAAFLLSPTEAVGFVARAGVSAIAGAGAGGGGAVFGYNLGGGVMVRPSSNAAVRADYTVRRLTLDDDRVSLPSLTFGVAWLH